MLKLINSKRIDYHSALIMNATKDNRAFFSGSAKAYSINKKFTWSGDFLFKHKTNTDINPHIGYLAFFSDHDITVDEYGNIEILHSVYPFLSSYEHDILPKYYSELSDNQYARIGQKFIDCEKVSLVNTYVNEGDVEDITDSFANPIYYNTTDVYPDGVTPISVKRYSHKHSSGYAPVFRSHGYKWTTVGADPVGNFMWIRKMDGSMGAEEWWNSESKNRLVIKNNFFYVDFLTTATDIGVNDTFMLSELPLHYYRVFNYFVQDNKNRIYFNQSNKWNIYFRDKSTFILDHYLNDVVVVELYDQYGVTINPTIPYTFYPDVTVDGIYEPAKLLVNWGTEITYRPADDGLRVEEGSAFINFGVCNENEPDDQSRLLYQTCNHMYTSMGGGSYELKVTAPGIVLTAIIEGIDFDTERQRRHSAVVMTQPYHVVQPIANSEVVEYMFVDIDGNPVTSGSFLTSPDIFLRIKSSPLMIKAINEKLATEEYNTDIINVFEIEDPEAALDLCSSTDTYFNFANTAFFIRQDYCIDDLINIGGTNYHSKFYIAPSGSQQYQYGGEMLVNGLGFASVPNFDSNGAYDGTVKRVLKVYCSNFVFSNPVVSYEFLSTSMATAVEHVYERFYPVIKLPNINGYVKILEKAKQFNSTRSSDGKHVTTYVVEFPYCPGSYSERVAMDFSSDTYKKAFIQYKKDYLSAGSHAVDYDLGYRYDNYNERKDFTFDELQCPMSAYVNKTVDPITHTEQHDGDYLGYVGDGSTSERRRRTIRYPANVVFDRFDPDLFILRENAPYRYFNIIHSYSASVDMKFILLPSSKMWKYDKHSYSSYINHENPSFVFDMDISRLFEDYSKYQEHHAIVPDIKRWLYGYVKSMASTTLSSSGLELPYTDDTGVFNPVESNIIIEIWDSQAQLFSGTIDVANWRPISMSLFDNGKSPGVVLVDKLSVYSGPDNHGDYVSYVFDMVDMPNGVYSFISAGYDDVSSFVGLSNKALYDATNGRVYHVVNTASEDGGARLRVYFKYSPTSDPALQTYNPTQDAIGTISIHEPLNSISKSKERDFFTNEASTIESDGIQNRMIDIKNTVLDPLVTGLTDLLRYVDADNKIKFRIRVIKNRDYPKTFKNKNSDDFQYTNNQENVPTFYDIIPWYTAPSWDATWDWSKIGLTEDILYFGLTYFQLLSK